MTFADMIRTWKGVRPADAEHAIFVSNAMDAGETRYNAELGYALVQKTLGNASQHKPNSDGSQPRPPCRVKHVGRKTFRKGRRHVRWDKGDPTTRLARAFYNTRVNRERREDASDVVQ